MHSIASLNLRSMFMYILVLHSIAKWPSLVFPNVHDMYTVRFGLHQDILTTYRHPALIDVHAHQSVRAYEFISTIHVLISLFYNAHLPSPPTRIQFDSNLESATVVNMEEKMADKVPRQFMNLKLRVFCRDPKKLPLARLAFERWCEHNGCSSPFPSSQDY